MRKMFVIILSVGLLSPTCWGGEQKPLPDQKSRESYVLGYEFGGNLKNQKVEVDINILFSAIKDGLEGTNPALSPEEVRNAMQQLQRKLMVAQNLHREESVAKNMEVGKAFLAANKTNEGVKALPSGLQYKVLHEGTGPIPQAADRVKVHYRGTLINGTEFDSSYNRAEPATVKVTGVIRGWTEALQLMKTGSKWQLFVPAELAYGARQFGRIPPNSTLIFELELLDLVK